MLKFFVISICVCAISIVNAMMYPEDASSQWHQESHSISIRDLIDYRKQKISLIDGAQLIFAFDQNCVRPRVVGLIMFVYRNGIIPYGYIDSVAVFTTYQHCGIGNHFMKLCMKEFEKTDAQYISLHSAHTAIKFYEKLKFYRDGDAEYREGNWYTPMRYDIDVSKN